MNLEITFRRIRKNKKWFSLNVLGLSVALACFLLVFAFVKNECSYDKFNTKADRIVRFTKNSNTGNSSLIDARLWVGWAPQLKEEFPQIEAFVRFLSFRNAMVDINQTKFYSKKVYGVDSTFFEVFDYKLLLGDKATLFKKPNQLAITKSMALKYFGTLDVLGKTIELLHQHAEEKQPYTLCAVMEDFPANSHFKPDMLCSIDESLESWAYTYFLLKEGESPQRLEALIQSYWDKQYTDRAYHPIANIQRLSDIHLYSHKSLELEQHGNVKSLYMLGAGALIILIIALINFTNLNYVQFLSEQKSYMVKAVNGATPFLLAKEFMKELLVLAFFVIALGYGLAFYAAKFLHYTLLSTLSGSMLFILFVFFALLIFLFALLPLLYRSTKQNTFKLASKPSYSYTFFIVTQLALSVFAISATLFLQKQIKHINFLHPDAHSANLLVVPNIPSQVIAKYPALKAELLKHSIIKQVSAAMEDPGGIVTDNFPYALDGEQSEEQKTINILCVDTNFFSFFNIMPIAGSLDFGTTSTLDWEAKAIENWMSGSLVNKIDVMPGKYIVNQMALKHMGIASAEDAIGKSFRLDFMGEMFPQGEIIGVVNDFHYTNMYVKEKPLVIIARKSFCHCLLFRFDAEQTANSLALIKATWQQINPEVPFTYEFITDSYQKIYQKEYNQMRVLMVFSIISILLSAMGLFAMVAFSLKIRIKEIGVRRVSGASVFVLINMLLSSYLRWVMVAFILACPFVYWAVSAWLQTFAYQTSLNWWVFALAGLLVLCVALLTVVYQTYRAASKNPVESLRYE